MLFQTKAAEAVIPDGGIAPDLIIMGENQCDITAVADGLGLRLFQTEFQVGGDLIHFVAADHPVESGEHQGHQDAH